MLLVFTSKELERIVEEFSKKSPKIEFLGGNRVKIKQSGISISLFLTEVRPRQLTFLYKMSSVVHFFVGKFVELDRPGIIWNKEENKISLDLDQLVQDKKLENFYIRQLLFDTEKMVVDFDLKEKSVEV
ncbi:hypothetical protein FHS59_000287 [Algoriphagus iocasae]|uniref:Uncharacterized protein n=1 Tax=Algoriphagus iocasae TaxID=1836499 RepID=A0A841M9R6_9BACT|nr:hypothetical protein [Algoriphagus iocasae]MBB6324672.1 hypothetical protein [Algoriphagus iocasae]